MSAENKSPWYVETFLAIGGWIAGLLAAVAIFAFAIAIVGDLKSGGSDIVAAFIALALGSGFVFAGVSLGGPDKGDFQRHFAIAATAAGLTAASAGVWYLLFKPFDGTGAQERIAAGGAGLATAALLALAGFLIARRMRDGILSFLTALAVYAIAFVSLALLLGRHAFEADHFLPPLCALLGAVLFLEKRAGAFVRPIGAALMIAPMIHFAASSNYRAAFWTGAMPPGAAIAGETAILAAALYCLTFLRGRYALAPLISTALLAVAAVWLLPNAGGIAIVILFAAIAANHRGLAVAGMIAAAWFIGRFYYDLSMTLLEKSAIMAGMGLLMLAGALFFQRRAKEAGEQTPAATHDRRGALALLGAGAAFALPLGYVNYGVFRLEAAFKDAREIYLPLAPVDPRSLIQGDYMVLNYDNAIYPPYEEIAALPNQGDAFLNLDENKVATFSRIAADGDVPGPDEIRVGYVRTAQGGLRYAPESWFFQEGEAEIFQPARFAIVLVAPDGRTRLVGLADESRVRLGAP